MSVTSLLNADVADLPTQVLRFWAWWKRELRAALGPLLRPLNRSSKPRLFLQYEGADSWALLDARGEALPDASARRRPVVLRLPPETVLRRVTTTPPLGARDAERLIVLDADRLTPYPAGAAYHLARASAAEPGQPRSVELFSVDKAVVDALFERAAAAGFNVQAVVAGDGGDAAPVNIFPLMARAAGGRARLDAIAWGLTVTLLFANLALAYGRDLQGVHSLEAAAASTHAQAAALRDLNRRAIELQAAVDGAARERARSEPLQTLDLLARTLPPDVVLKRAAWSGATLRISGARGPGRDIAGDLKRTTMWRSVDDLTAPGVQTPESFDLSLRPSPLGPAAAPPSNPGAAALRTEPAR